MSFNTLRMIGGNSFGLIGGNPFRLSLSFDKLRMIGGTPFGLSLSKPVFGAVLRQAQDQRPVSNGGPR